MSGGTFYADYEDVRLTLAAYLELMESEAELPLVIDDDWVAEQFADDRSFGDEPPQITYVDGFVHIDGQWYVGDARSEVDFGQEILRRAEAPARAQFFYDGDGENRWRLVKDEHGSVTEHYPIEVWPTDTPQRELLDEIGYAVVDTTGDFITIERNSL